MHVTTYCVTNAQVLAPSVVCELQAKDGDLVSTGSTLAVLSGPSHEVSHMIAFSNGKLSWNTYPHFRRHRCLHSNEQCLTRWGDSAASPRARTHSSKLSEMSLERTASEWSNFCGIGPFASMLMMLVRMCRAVLLDTRKTTPGLRVLEKYAVRCGGGFCHRCENTACVVIKQYMHMLHPSLRSDKNLFTSRR
jgi:nicotinate-nucleotide pyrophosphorylase